MAAGDAGKLAASAAASGLDPREAPLPLTVSCARRPAGCDSCNAGEGVPAHAPSQGRRWGPSIEELVRKTKAQKPETAPLCS